MRRNDDVTPAHLTVDSPSPTVMARLDRVITLNIVLMPMARSSRAMTKGPGHDERAGLDSSPEQ
jgi:hypothetical protein